MINLGLNIMLMCHSCGRKLNTPVLDHDAHGRESYYLLLVDPCEHCLRMVSPQEETMKLSFMRGSEDE